MQPRTWWALSALGCLVVPLGFGLGRWSASEASNVAALASETASSQLRAVEKAGASGKEATDFSTVAIENLGQVEFDHAFNLIRSAPREALSAWSKRLEALPVTPRKTSAISVFFKTLAQIDARTAVDLALGLDRADPRWVAINCVAVATPASSLNEVARMYSAISNTRQAIAGDLISRWSMTDPEATARFLASYSGKVSNEDIGSFIGNWAALDPVAAREWLAQADPARRDAGVYANLYAGWVFSDRTAALEDLALRATDKTFKKAVKVVSETLFTQSPDVARAFVLALPPSAQVVAVDQVAGHITGFYFGGDYLHLKPDEVTKWVFSLPDNLWKEQIGYLVDRWINADTGAANAWLNQMSPHQKDHLLAEHLRATYNGNSPTAGFESGLRISDPALREDVFREIFKDMDDDVKKELFQRIELPPEDANRLRRILKRL